jgi:KUP system potassium uptake protein
VLSLIFWALTISVSLKYLTVIMRADNQGEGGILALFALAQRRLITGSTWAKVAVGLALAGTAFFFCDALITPAISVLSAVEGLEVLNPGLKSWVIPVTITVIAVLFAYQHRGTAAVAALFGPIMVVWFAVIAVIGAIPVARHPEVLVALNPWYGLALLFHRPHVALAIIGAAFLAITGGEALYADMGHFGKRPVRMAWFALVGPALVLNYFGQGALLLELGKPIEHPLFHLVPAAVLPWLVMLATAATVIASQATISGAFSIASQAVHLDLVPRLKVLQTSALEQGQIYVPIVNWLVFPAVILFVVGFGSSDALGGAYGAAVVGTMAVTTILGAFVAATQWNWPKWRVAGLFGLMLITDSAFVAGNMTKVPAGGWIPLTLGAALYLIFMTWRSGRIELRAALAKLAVPRSVGADPQHRAQRRSAPARHHPQRRDRRHAAPGSLRQAQHRRVGAGRVLHHRALRLHGNPGRRRSAQGVPYARAARFHRGQLLLRRPPRGARAPAARPARPAAAAVRAHAAVQHAGGGILPHAVPRRRDPQYRGGDMNA